MVSGQGILAKVRRTPHKGEPCAAIGRVATRKSGNFSASLRGEKSFGVIRKKARFASKE
jgi:hypothetical protein